MTTTIELPSETSPRTSRRRRGPTARVAAALATGALLLVIGAVTVANHLLADNDKEGFTANGIHELVINQDAGDVTLVPSSAAGEVKVETSRRWAGNKPDTRHTVVDGVLTLNGDCPTFGLGTCDVDRLVTVPAGIAVRVGLSSGSVDATNLNLVKLDVTTDSGSIHGAGMTVPSFRGITSSGSVEASFATSPTDVTAESSAGHVTLTVPDAVYKVDADTYSGQVRIEVPQDPDATSHISAYTSSGDVTVARR